MRNISFAMTTAQIRNRSKTVTRRAGWKDLKPGTLLQPVEKCQGLKKGERVTKIGGPIRVVSVRREPLNRMKQPEPNHYGRQECIREGFPHFSVDQFIDMFRVHNGWRVADVTRIEFVYMEANRR